VPELPGVGAELLQRPRALGVVAPGAYADLLVVDGNPLDEIRVLTTPASTLKLVMNDGKVHTNEL
jgi:imidazolonepropionase-like amidohydrolase